MKWKKASDKIEYGDIVLLHCTPLKRALVELKEGDLKHTGWGIFDHKDIVSSKYGNIVNSKCQQYKAYIFPIDPSTWTNLLTHRTQIVYNCDASTIISNLFLKCGSVVVESGTGSASMTYHLANCVGPFGKVYTYEFHEDRALNSQHVIKSLKIDGPVFSKHRDVVKNGFDVTDVADAVFLDLPYPWKAIDASVQTFKKNTECRIATFSPCVEQVQKTYISLKKAGFQDIETVETITKNYNLFKKQKLDILALWANDENYGFTSYLTFASFWKD